jgi:hypothetical protein
VGGAPPARRALVAFDAATGRRFAAFEFEGVIEGVHSAGPYLLVAVAPSGGAPGRARGAEAPGALVLLEFGGREAAPPARRRGRAA